MGGALTACTIPFSGATLVHVCVDQRETIQVQPLLSISLFLLRAPHRIKDSFVLIELRRVLFIELWKPFLCSSPFLYHRHCHSQKKCWGRRGGGGGREGEREGGACFKELHGDLVTCLPLTSIAGTGQKSPARSYTHLFEQTSPLVLLPGSPPLIQDLGALKSVVEISLPSLTPANCSKMLQM